MVTRYLVRFKHRQTRRDKEKFGKKMPNFRYFGKDLHQVGACGNGDYEVSPDLVFTYGYRRKDDALKSVAAHLYDHYKSPWFTTVVDVIAVDCGSFEVRDGN